MRQYFLRGLLKNYASYFSLTKFHTSNGSLYPITVKMPALSPTMAEGTIVEWHKKEGEEVLPGDLLCEVQTDKAVVGMDYDDEGILAKIIAPSGDKQVTVGAPIAVIALPDENWEEVAQMPVDVEAKADPAPKKEEKPVESKTSSEKSGGSQSGLIGPAVRLLLDSHDIDSSSVQGTGPKDNILKGDAEEPYESIQNLTPTTSDYIDIELSSMRKTIAARLVESKTTIPHLYTKRKFNIDKMIKLRKKLVSEGLKVSFNDFIIKACSKSLRLVPEVNSTSGVDADGKECLFRHANVDISIAVATPKGLITPIVFDADNKSITSIASDVKSLAVKARENKLQPNEFIGGSFSISNLGMFGVREFLAIINPPQTAILAVGSGMKYLAEHGDELSESTSLTLGLSTDSRFIDEVTAGKFLDNLANILEKYPQLLVMDDELCRSAVSENSPPADDFNLMQLHG